MIIKIVIALLVPILLGVVVGSNLSIVMTVVIFNQSTITLPIGVWLVISIGAGLLSSIVIQLAMFVDRRLLKRQIRQLQSRLQQSDEDIFMYTSQVAEPEKPAIKQPDSPPPKTSRFSSFRFGKTDDPKGESTTKFTTTPSSKSMGMDHDDDWEVEPVSNRQLDWEDPTPSRQQKNQIPNTRFTIEDEPNYPDRRTQIIDSQPPEIRREIYDADFRLIQPPYKQPIETADDDDRDSTDFEYTDADEADDFDPPSSIPKSPSPSRTPSTQNLDDDDWGFDFEDRDTSIQAK